MIELQAFTYAPALKWKQGELRGLANVSRDRKSEILPLVSVPPPGSFDNEEGKVLTPSEQVKSFAPRMSAAWAGRFCFLDTRHIDNPDFTSATGGEHPLLALISRSRLAPSPAICAPMTSIEYDKKYQNAVQRFHSRDPRLPICIRVPAEFLDDPTTSAHIEKLLDSIGCQPQNVALVIDASELDYQNPGAIADALVAGINAFPHLYKWRLLVLTLCSLPSKVIAKPNETTEFQRLDWSTFLQVSDRFRKGELLRLPIYSDHGTESAAMPIPKPVRPATQLRYTASEKLYIFKGKNTKEVGYRGIFPVARRLVRHPDFFGRDFSYGDARIADLAEIGDRPGNASVWKEMGFTHHMAVVQTQLDSILGRTPRTRAVVESDVAMAFLPGIVKE